MSSCGSSGPWSATSPGPSPWLSFSQPPQTETGPSNSKGDVRKDLLDAFFTHARLFFPINFVHRQTLLKDLHREPETFINSLYAMGALFAKLHLLSTQKQHQNQKRRRNRSNSDCSTGTASSFTSTANHNHSDYDSINEETGGSGDEEIDAFEDLDLLLLPSLISDEQYNWNRARRRLLAGTVETPSLRNVQTLLLMGLLAAWSHSNLYLSGMYISMANRMALDMQLNIDPDDLFTTESPIPVFYSPIVAATNPLPPAVPVMSPARKEERRRTWWGCILLDRIINTRNESDVSNKCRVWGVKVPVSDEIWETSMGEDEDENEEGSEGVMVDLDGLIKTTAVRQEAVDAMRGKKRKQPRNRVGIGVGTGGFGSGFGGFEQMMHPLRSWRHRFNVYEIAVPLAELCYKVAEYATAATSHITSTLQHQHQSTAARRLSNGWDMNGKHQQLEPWNVHTELVAYDSTLASLSSLDSQLDMLKAAFLPPEFFGCSVERMFELLQRHPNDPQIWMGLFFRLAYSTAKVILHRPAMLALLVKRGENDKNKDVDPSRKDKKGMTFAEMENIMKLHSARHVSESHAREVAQIASFIQN
ncbi:hypothetical protein HK102_004132, partial [Quaeritorhiza haematococci]